LDRDGVSVFRSFFHSSLMTKWLLFITILVWLMIGLSGELRAEEKRVSVLDNPTSRSLILNNNYRLGRNIKAPTIYPVKSKGSKDLYVYKRLSGETTNLLLTTSSLLVLIGLILIEPKKLEVVVGKARIKKRVVGGSFKENFYRFISRLL
jgi:hypothetical protein